MLEVARAGAGQTDWGHVPATMKYVSGAPMETVASLPSIGEVSFQRGNFVVVEEGGVL